MMDAGERQLFTRGVQDLTARAAGPDLDRGLAELGWLDAYDADPQVAVQALFEAQGSAAAASRALDLVLAAALGAGAGPVVLPPFGTWAAAGRIDGTSVVIDGVVLGGLPSGSTALVVATTGDGVALVSVDVDRLTARAVEGLDPALGLVVAQGATAASAVRPLTDAAWAGSVAAGRRALAHELVGASSAMLELARDHALERVQFDRPIAGFQAVRHRLAEAYVAVEASAAALDAAWADGSPFTATVAKAIAGRSARTVARHAQQVLAGIGFTSEHPFHRYLRRTRTLDGLLGDSRSLTRHLGQQLLDAGALPPIFPL